MDKYIKYEKRIVLYLDILGFKSAIDKSIEDYGILKSIHKVLNNIYSDRVKNYHGPLEGASYGMHVSVFSDNIVMSIPYETENFFTISFVLLIGLLMRFFGMAFLLEEQLQ